MLLVRIPQRADPESTVRLYGTAESAESKGPWPQRIALCPRWWYMVQPERRGEERERETRLAAEDEEREERALRSGIRNTVRKCGVCGKTLASLKAQDWTEEKFCISLNRDSG